MTRLEWLQVFLLGWVVLCLCWAFLILLLSLPMA